MLVFNATSGPPAASGGLYGGLLGGVPRQPAQPRLLVPRTVSGSYQPGAAATAGLHPAPAPAAAPTAAAAGGSYGGSMFDLAGDPSVNAVTLANQQAYANTVAAQQANAKQALIGAGFNFGDLLGMNPDLAGSPIGSVLTDQSTQQAATANPYSIAAQLGRTHASNNVQINEGANDRNLYHSSTRANTLGDEATSYLGNVAAGENSVLGGLSGNIAAILAEKQRESDLYGQTVLQARQDAIQNAITSGGIFLGYNPDGTPIVTGGAPATTAAAAAAAPAVAGALRKPAAKKPAAAKSPAAAPYGGQAARNSY